MTPADLDRVFGRGRLKMLTGAHVEVFREAAAPAESRRYTKRFLTTAEGDYAHWTEREWRILARLIGHGTRCVPDVVQYDRGAQGTKLVQTYDAGATVDQWATLLPVERDGRVYAHVFEDCAHWWALAHHCLTALDEIHTLGLVHLDVKGDNICIPIGPVDFDPAAPDARLFPVFGKLALIDFAFSLVAGESLTSALPIGWQHDYDYQSPRLLHALEAGRAGDLAPTESLDWRCDFYSLAAMLNRYLPAEDRLYGSELAHGWTDERYDAARSLVARLREAHDGGQPSQRPHAELIETTSGQVREIDLSRSLERGWTLARDARTAALPALPPTPVTRIAPSLRVVIPPRDDPALERAMARVERSPSQSTFLTRRRTEALAAATLALVIGGINSAHVGTWYAATADRVRAMVSALRDVASAPSNSNRAVAANESVPEPFAPPDDVSEPAAAEPAPRPPPPVPREQTNPPEKRSLAAQIESYRQSTRSTRAAPTAPASAAKSSRQAVLAKSKASQSPSVLASKRPHATAAVSPKPPLKPLTFAQLVARTPPAAPPPQFISAQPVAAPAFQPPTPVIAPAAPAPVEPQRVAPRAIPTPVEPAPSPPLPAAASAPAPNFDASPAPTLPTFPAPQRPSIADSPPALRPDGPSGGDDAYLQRARRTLDHTLPRTSALARAKIARALWIASNAHHPAQERAVIEAIASIDGTSEAALAERESAPADARRLHHEAHRAYWSRRQLGEALAFSLKAFGANPNDPEIAGYLAFLHLKALPSEPERARQLALHAIGARTARDATARPDDWITFAIASALSGRQADATHALFATLAMTQSADRACRAALAALASYGQKVREPVVALLQRVHMQGRSDDSPSCARAQEGMLAFRAP